jgi:hypothetical protein
MAAVWAPSEHANALRFVARTIVMVSLVVASAGVIVSRARARLVAAAFVSIATVVASVGVLEAMQTPAVMTLLTAFRPGFHVVAGQLRATSTLFYPTIASMYLEVAFVIGVWLLLDGSRRTRVAAFAALVVIGAGISVTFTRAGLIAMGTALVAISVLCRLRAPAERPRVRVLSALATVLLVVVFLSHSPELLAARASTEGSHAWYGADYDVPATLTLQTAGVHKVPLSVTNTGRLTWDSRQSPAFALSYHWLRPNGVVVSFEGQRTLFPQPVAPGRRITVDADVIAPSEPGEYVLAWDVVHETRAWLSTEGVAVATTRVQVRGEPTATATSEMSRLPGATIRPARPALWAAALAMAQDHPLLGVGPDNYRLRSGAYLHAGQWDPRVHANNMYLEILAGAGILGLAAFTCVVGGLGVVLWRRVRHATARTHLATATGLTVWTVIAGHGVVDSFLTFTPTYVTFAVACGWALSRGVAGEELHAHRV